MADNASFFHDTRAPFFTSDLAAISPLTTDVALYTTAAHAPFPSGYWWVGKRVRYRLFGKITTAATPGNGTFDVYWGTGASANGTILVSSAAQTLVANQTNLSWELDLLVKCTAVGASGALYATGRAFFNTSVIAAGTFLLPASAAATTTVDTTTASNIVSIQFKRSGSTAEAMTVQDMGIYPEN